MYERCPSCEADVRDGYEHVETCPYDGWDRRALADVKESWDRQAEIDRRGIQ